MLGVLQLKGSAMPPKGLEALKRELATLLDTATSAEADELREIQPLTGWRAGGEVSLPHGNAAAVMELIATAEENEWSGLLPHGSGQNLRQQLRERITQAKRPWKG
jgi:hypothetical protein